MRILITGGAGFIGSHIAEKALESGHEVAVLDDLSSGRRENVPGRAKFYEVDIRDAAATARAFTDFAPEAVSHQAAQASVVVSMREPALDVAVNVIGGLNVLEAACTSGARHLVFASTGGAIYGNIAAGLADEQYPRNPLSPYAIDKLCFELLMAAQAPARGLRTTVLRYANVYGPRQDPHGEAGVVAIFSQRALAGQALRVFAEREEGDDGCIRDYVYVSDAVRANLAALEGKLAVSLLNVATSIPTSTRGLAVAIARLEGSGVVIESGPPRAGDVARSVLDSTLFRQHVGEPIAFERGLAETVDWFTKQRK